MTNPLYLECMPKISILKKEGIVEKISYERHAYEPADDGSYLLGNISTINGKQNSDTNELEK